MTSTQAPTRELYFAALATLLAATSAHAQSNVYPAPSVSVADSGGGVIAADFNGDGLDDIVSLPSSFAGEIVLSRGGGQFEPPRKLDAIRLPVHAVDVNGDGKLDLCGSWLGNVRVLPGDGHGNFGSAIDTPGGLFAWDEFADFDGDGIVDALIQGSASSGGLFKFLKGTGGGTFASPVPIGTFASGLGEFHLADVDGDGRLDVVAAFFNTRSSYWSLSWYRNLGGASLAAPELLSTPPFLLGQFSLADVTGDSRADVLTMSVDVTSSTPGTVVSLLENRANGHFGAPIALAMPEYIRDLHAVDVDGDGLDDVVYSSSPNGSLPMGSIPEIGVLRSLGKGAFAPVMHVPTAIAAYHVAVGDWSGDGVKDLMFASGVTNTNRVELIKGRVGLKFDSIQQISTRDAIDSLQVVNVVGDGLDDLVYADFDAGAIAVAENLGGAHFAAPISYAVPNRPRVVRAADLNGDGRPDFAVFEVDAAFNATVSVLIAGAIGWTSTGVQFAVHPNDADGLELADIDGDQLLDIVVPHDGAIQLARGKGDGTFAAPTSIAMASSWYALAAGDLDGDGHTDLVSLTYPAHLPAINWNDGHGGFSSVAQLNTAVSTQITLADVDGDGDLDVLIADINGPVVLRNEGARVFTPLHGSAIQHLGPDTRLLALDVDGDQVRDLVFDGAFEAYVEHGHGDGTFDAPQRFALGFHPFGLAAADLDGNGQPDLLTWNGPFRAQITYLLHH